MKINALERISRNDNTGREEWVLEVHPNRMFVVRSFLILRDMNPSCLVIFWFIVLENALIKVYVVSQPVSNLVIRH